MNPKKVSWTTWDPGSMHRHPSSPFTESLMPTNVLSDTVTTLNHKQRRFPFQSKVLATKCLDLEGLKLRLTLQGTIRFQTSLVRWQSRTWSKRHRVATDHRQSNEAMCFSNESQCDFSMMCFCPNYTQCSLTVSQNSLATLQALAPPTTVRCSGLEKQFLVWPRSLMLHQTTLCMNATNVTQERYLHSKTHRYINLSAKEGWCSYVYLPTHLTQFSATHNPHSIPIT